MRYGALVANCGLAGLLSSQQPKAGDFGLTGGTMTVGGVDTYYDYDEKQWKSRRLGGGPIRRGPT